MDKKMTPDSHHSSLQESVSYKICSLYNFRHKRKYIRIYFEVPKLKAEVNRLKLKQIGYL